jgi:hypothetical protein
MARVNVFIREQGNFAKQQLSIIKDLANKQIKEMTDETVEVMRNHITSSIQRPNSSGNLANNITAEKILNGYGVGNISLLNTNAPYWHWINYGVAQSGRTIPPATKGYFSPGDPIPNSNSFRDGRFTQDSDGYMMIPTRPIQPHNFIQRTIQEIPLIINSVLSRRNI